jgi:hypothetical protein
MTWLAPLLVAVAAPSAGGDAKQSTKPAAARVTVAAELACLHCTFGEGDGCAVCLKLDAKTPVLLGGKVARQFEDMRLSKKPILVTGALSVGKDKRLLLTADSGRLLTDSDRGKTPPAGQVRIEGTPACGSCDLKLCDECTLAIVNAAAPIILDGKLAREHAEGARAITAVGRPFLDRRGLLRLDATKVDLVKGK